MIYTQQNKFYTLETHHCIVVLFLVLNLLPNLFLKTYCGCHCQGGQVLKRWKEPIDIVDEDLHCERDAEELILAANQGYFNAFSPSPEAGVISENWFKNEISYYHRSLENDQGWCICVNFCLLLLLWNSCNNAPLVFQNIHNPDMRRSSSNKQRHEIIKNFRLQSHTCAPGSLSFSCEGWFRNKEKNYNVFVLMASAGHCIWAP